MRVFVVVVGGGGGGGRGEASRQVYVEQSM